MNVEIKSRKKNYTWELVRHPSRKKHVGCKWAYTIKYQVDGPIKRYKAQLAANGYIQTME